MARQRRQVTIYTEPRLHYWFGETYNNEVELILPAEIITPEMEIRLVEMSKYGVNERNENEVEHVWHWHFTIEEDMINQVRFYLVSEFDLVETFDLHEVW